MKMETSWKNPKSNSASLRSGIRRAWTLKSPVRRLHRRFPDLESAIRSGHTLLIVSDNPTNVQILRDFLHASQNTEMKCLASTNSGRSHAACLSRTKVRSATWWDGTWDVPTLIPVAPVSLDEVPVGARDETPILNAAFEKPGDPAVPPDAYPR